jgi:hypothetical protein
MGSINLCLFSELQTSVEHSRIEVPTPEELAYPLAALLPTADNKATSYSQKHHFTPENIQSNEEIPGG